LVSQALTKNKNGSAKFLKNGLERLEDELERIKRKVGMRLELNGYLMK
jgi:hypothetical protein